MIKFDNVQIFGWKAATLGARNAFQSWDKSDSDFNKLGKNDLGLLSRLSKAGTDHGKFMRMIHVQADVTAPVYFMQEFSTYKVGVTINSTSLQHTGSKRDFTIRDFSVQDERIYDILDPPKKDFKKENPIIYPYETDEYRDYVTESGRKYKVFRNGKVFSYPFDYTDTFGRHRHFDEFEVSPYQSRLGYWRVRIGGRDGEHLFLHRLVAMVWLGDRSLEGLEINHKNKMRGDCSIENLEWVTHKESENYDSDIYYLFASCDIWREIINSLNYYRNQYIETGDYSYFKTMRQLMPMGYNYKFTIDLNYAVLKNIYHARKEHKLDEWRVFCDWIESLPYSDELIVG